MNGRTLAAVSLLALPLTFISPQSVNASEAAHNTQAIQAPIQSESQKAVSEVAKPSEAEAIAAAVAYLTRDGKLTVEETEFLTWGTYSEQYVYWPIKFRMSYKRKDSDKPRTNDYALKISKGPDGQWQAAQYYSWRTDFK
jgi:hypothetical protein